MSTSAPGDTDQTENESTVDATTTATTVPAVPHTSHSTSFRDSPRCGRCGSWCRSLCTSSPNHYCCFIPAKIWLKLRLCAVFAMLLGLFLLIIFPVPESLIFVIAVVLLALSGSFVIIDIVRGMVANSWFGRFGSSVDTERARTIEVIGNTRYEDHENPAFTESDSPPDYDTVVASSPRPPDLPAGRPPDITFNMNSIARSSQNTVSSPDVLPRVVYNPAMSPTSMVSFDGAYSIPERSPPPSYEDVISENNARQMTETHQQDDSVPDPSSA